MSKDSTGGSIKLSPKDPSIGLSTQIDDIDKTLSDNEIFGEYSDVILRSFPFMSLLEARQLFSQDSLERFLVHSIQKLLHPKAPDFAAQR